MTEEALFELLVNTPAADRPAVLTRECHDPAGRARLLALLAADDPATVSLADAAPTADPDRTHTAAETVGTAGEVVGGRYKLVEVIGEGGMGSVWMAQQTEPLKRAVAVKLIKAGMDSKAVLARFDAERQALALMDHPNIAKVLDAGATPDGRPYFVMELVKGIPITKFCDERKLTPKARLELFVQVCQAVQHAHQKGVIHRDLKPGNVLVALYDDRPVPKVIDFGVAKATGGALTDHTLMTGFGAVVGTPEYMSPEQASFNAVDVDTRSDVYALGVLLYELLTGSTPVDRKSLDRAALLEILRIVREVDAPRPSAKLSTSDALPSISANRGIEPKALTGLLRSELDWIAMKALEKDRSRRYDTANGFAADIQRYLAGEPVHAHPPGTGYRLRKFARMHRGPVVAAGVIAVVVLLGVMGITGGMVWALDAEGKAKADRDAALKARGEADDERNRANGERNRANDEAEKVKGAKEQQVADQYLWDVQLLPLAFEKGTAAEVNKLLERHVPTPGEPDRRGFEWHYWNRQQNPQVLTARFGTGGTDSRSTWSASDDGRRVARLDPPVGADALPTLTVWDRGSRTVQLTYRIPSRPPEGGNWTWPLGLGPQFSPDGRRVVVEWSYSVRDATPPGVAVGPGGPNPMRFVNHVRQVIDVDTGKVLFEPPGTSRFSRTRFSGDGRRFASVSSGAGGWGGVASSTTLTVWDVESGKGVSPEMPASYFQGVLHPDGETFLTTDLARDPDPATAAVGGGGTQVFVTRLALRHVKTGAERWGRLVPCECLDDLAVSPDGRLVAATLTDGLTRRSRARAVGIWDAATGEPLRAWPLPDGEATPFVLGLAFSPRGTRLAVSWSAARPNGPDAGPSGGPSECTLLDTRTGEPIPSLTGLGGFGPSIELAYSPDEKRVARTGGPTIDVWDTRTGGRPLVSFRTPVNPPQFCRFTSDGQRLWTLEASGNYKEWELRPPRPVAVDVEGGNALQTADFAASGDGERFAHLVEFLDEKTGATEFRVRVRDVAGKSLMLLTPPPREVATGTSYRRGLAFDHAGQRVLLTRSEGRGVGIGERMPDDWRAGLTPPDLTVWDTTTGGRLFHQALDDELTPGGGSNGHLAALSADGRTVATGAEPAKAGEAVRVRRFDVDTGREQAACTLAGATTLAALAISPDGKRVAAVAVTVTRDKEMRRLSMRLVVWGEGGGEPVATTDLARDAKAPSSFGFRGFLQAGVVWTPDGSRLVVSHRIPPADGFAIHDAATGKPLVVLELPPSALGDSATATGAVCSPDGKRVAAFVGAHPLQRPEVKVWDIASGKAVLTLRKSSGVLGFGGLQSPDRRLVFTPGAHELVAWECDQVPEWTPERGDYTVPAYVRTLWAASPPPEAKK